MQKIHPLKFIPFIIIGLLLLAIATLPYGYYTFLRIVVFIYTGLLAYQYLSDENYNRGLIFATIGIIYNPISPIHLTKEIRIVINLLVAITIIIYLISNKNKRKILTKKVLEEKLKKELKKQEKIETFFKENPEAEKELDAEIKSRSQNPKKINSKEKNKTHKCGVPAIQRAKEKIYNKHSKKD